MRARRIISLGLVLSLLAACGAAERMRSRNAVVFDGVEFRARAEQVGESREEFAVSVRGVSRSIDGARQAASHAATRYCIANYGRSDKQWDLGPDAENLTVENDTLTFRGRCEGW